MRICDKKSAVHQRSQSDRDGEVLSRRIGKYCTVGTRFSMLTEKFPKRTAAVIEAKGGSLAPLNVIHHMVNIPINSISINWDINFSCRL